MSPTATPAAPGGHALRARRCLLNAVAACAGIAGLRAGSLRARLLPAIAGAGAACALWGDMSAGHHWFRRAFLPSRTTWNVVGEIGTAADQRAGGEVGPAAEPSAGGETEPPRTVVLIAHHDAAHTGVVFHPALPRFFPDRFPALHERSTQTAPIMYLTWLGSVLVGTGALLRGLGLRSRSGPPPQ